MTKNEMNVLVTAYAKKSAALLRDVLTVHRALVTEEVYRNLRERIGSAPAPRKAKRGRRHCTKCNSVKHDARNCKKGKAAKKATIHVLAPEKKAA